jgi:hypothetical protein
MAMQADEPPLRRFDGWLVRHPLVARIASAMLFGFGLFVAAFIRSPSLIEASVVAVASALVFGMLVYPRFGPRSSNDNLR